MVNKFFVFLAIACLSFAVHANGSSCDNYIGDWYGIDKEDGGEGHKRFWKSILGFKNIGNDSYHGPCVVPGKPEINAGWPAKTQSDNLSCVNGKLIGDWALTCFQFSPPKVISLEVEYSTMSGDRVKEQLLRDGQPLLVPDGSRERQPIIYTRGK